MASRRLLPRLASIEKVGSRPGIGGNGHRPERLVGAITLTEIASQNQANTMHAKPNRDTVPQVINGRINGRFAPGYSGNPGGSPEAARKALNKDTILEMHRAFKLGGRKAIEEVMRNQPAVFLKLLVLLVPREMQVERTGGVKAMTEDQIVDAIEAIEGYLARRSGEAAKVKIGRASWRGRG